MADNEAELSQAEMDALFDDSLADILISDGGAEEAHRESYERGPLYGYMGCKLTALPKILPKLPYDNAFIEVFGGSGTVMLNRKQSKTEVFNDRHSGVVAMFRVLRDPVQCAKLVEMINLTPYSREEFIRAKHKFYDEPFETDLERAHAWYILVAMSYAGNSRTWQRWLPKSCDMRIERLFERVPHLSMIGQRFSRVMVENLDWRTCLRDYDSPNSVFYLDPPYVDSNVYKLKMSREDHIEMCNVIMKMKGFVMLSGYPCELYDRFTWDHHEKWTVANGDPVWGRYDAIYIKDFSH